MNIELPVREVRWHGDGIYELELDRRAVEFTPGDCLALYEGEGDGISRPYSIASGTDEDCLRFVIRRVDGGQVSDHLWRLGRGDPVRVSEPFGWFRPGRAVELCQPYIFVATGTGIAPFLAHLRSEAEVQPLALLWGVRWLDDTVDLDFLRQRCDLRLAVSRERIEGAHHGRVTELLDELPVVQGCHYYLCGLDAMIEQTMGWLLDHGVSARQIHREAFFNAPA